ncbi:DEAD-box ATP-dependent RNA helicase 36-like isoform X2 [Cucurbita maxima]|uniref:DEAD-box ATP-dependent RNA helicase 36-like isoform X2 n=1 Tax=Cucurbita maxima TaxID=3661 RepID=A0A6J1JD07_CUCMA|nr:DEAD-box ATP-dependent RNA helicase 36-like isoform X2 [Cucurbita maxima]
MNQEVIIVDENFPLFSKPHRKNHKPSENPSTAPVSSAVDNVAPKKPLPIEKSTELGTKFADDVAFADLGLSEAIARTCEELAMKKPTAVQTHCIPKILAGLDVLGIAQTGSGKTAAFALPILQRLSETPFGVFALVITPTRELGYQLAEQFRALGSGLNLRCSVVVGGMDMLNQTQSLLKRPHLVIATPGRVKVLLEENPDIHVVFSKTKFLVLDEADRLLEVGFEEELKVIFQCLPLSRQTLLFSATLTKNLETLLELSANKAYFYEAYEGFKTVDMLKQQYVLIPKDRKNHFLRHILSKMEHMGIRSAIIFVQTCKSCHQLGLLLETLNQEVAALHSFKSQSQRLAALYRFKSGQVPVLLATDVASRDVQEICTPCGTYCTCRQRRIRREHCYPA